MKKTVSTRPAYRNFFARDNKDKESLFEENYIVLYNVHPKGDDSPETSPKVSDFSILYRTHSCSFAFYLMASPRQMGCKKLIEKEKKRE